MRSGNPALRESTFLDSGSGSVVTRDGQAMTLNGTVNKTGALLLMAVITAAFAWSQSIGADGMPLPVARIYMIAGAIGGLVFALATSLK
ncbi:Bax inhibitor-1/YccA family membrane protein, partial [Xanthomonas citri]